MGETVVITAIIFVNLIEIIIIIFVDYKFLLQVSMYYSNNKTNQQTQCLGSFTICKTYCVIVGKNIDNQTCICL